MLNSLQKISVNSHFQILNLRVNVRIVSSLKIIVNTCEIYNFHSADNSDYLLLG
jgi:hypothetical protein